MHHILNKGAALLAAVAAALVPVAPAGAGERVLHRSVLPDGSVAYGDKPVPGARADTELRVEPHPADPEAARRAQASLQQQRIATLRAYDARQARIAELDRTIAEAIALREAASQDRESAAMFRDGDRQGRRITSQYRQRQAEAAAKEEATARRLSALEQARAGLLP